MTRHIACLTFDFDAMSGFVSRGMTSPTPVSRGEFGAVGGANEEREFDRSGVVVVARRVAEPIDQIALLDTALDALGSCGLTQRSELLIPAPAKMSEIFPIPIVSMPDPVRRFRIVSGGSIEKSCRFFVRWNAPGSPRNGRAMTRPMRSRSAIVRQARQIS